MRSSTTRGAGFAAFALALLLPAAVHAQGNISTLGFGYPAGQVSTRALGTGAALAESDPLSVSNPASILGFGGSALYFQAEPEYRTLNVGGQTERTRIARYPLVVASIPVSPTIMLGLSFSNLLDRSFETQSRGSQRISDTVLATTNSFRSDGAIGDVRVAAAWVPRNWVHVGIAAHAITGDNRVRNTQVFDDSTRFASLVDTATVGYTGNAYSAGVEFLAGGVLSIGASYRYGGHLSLKRGDTTVSTARVPDRMSVGLAYLGIKGTSIAARTSKENWTAMRSLGSAALRVSDVWDTSVGADVLGPRLGERTVQLRAGYRWRTLPFGLPGVDVTERSFSVGAGTLFSRGRAALDVAAIRSARAATSTLSENAWTLSVGVTVRP